MTFAQSSLITSSGASAAADVLLAVNCLAALVAIALVAAIPAWAQRKLLSNQGTPRRLLLLMLPACVVAGFLTALALPADLGYYLSRHGVFADDSRVTMAVTFAAGFCAAAAAMFASVGWWDAVRTVGTRRAPKRLARLLPCALAYFTAAAIAALVWHRWRLAPEAWSGLGAWSLLGVLVPVGLNAGGIARALANRGLDRFASLSVALFPTALFLLATWIIFGRPLRADPAGDPISALGLDPAPTTAGSLVGYAVAYLLIVFALGIGGWVGIRLAPKPRLRSTRSPVDPRLHEAEFASVAARQEGRNPAATPKLRLVGGSPGGSIADEDARD